MEEKIKSRKRLTYDRKVHAVSELAKQISRIQNCSEQDAQRLIDLQGAWSNDADFPARWQTIQRKWSKWKPASW